MNKELLVIKDIVTGYDQANVLTGVTLKVNEGEVTCLLGANGVGKSTLIKNIFGLLPIRQGSITFDGIDISHKDTHQIVKLGIAAIPEGNRVFPKMSVLDNLKVGAYLESSASKIAQRLNKVFDLFPRLAERHEQFAGTLSGGERSMLSIGRALMNEPRLLVIDEPSLGLSPLYVKENFRLIAQLAKTECTILLIEQNVKQTLEVAQKGYVLAQGKVVVEGSSDVLRSSPEVGQAYFGSEEKSLN